jgi:metallo-beta-lactamase family protein
MNSRLTFLGANGTVTGSRHMLETRGKRFLVDCGLFQGPKTNRLKNWEPFPFDAREVDGVILTHAHVDHIGLLPRLVKEGFAGPVYGTRATCDLAKILLPDTGHLQEEEARWANKRGYTRHKPALPLFTEEDAKQVFQYLTPVDYGQHFVVDPHVRGQYRDAGHILGSAFVDLKATRLQGSRKIVFGGDLGRPYDAILRAPSQPYDVDYLVLESTYGNRLHDDMAPVAELARVIRQSMERGGVLVIPSFAVGRTQTILFLLRQLEEAGDIPVVPVYVDSPMAVEALQVHRHHIADLNLAARKVAIGNGEVFRPRKLQLSVTRNQSIAINGVDRGAIIISASGMVNGGRILHHLDNRLPDERNTVLFIGYQAEGTRGRSIVDGKETVRMFGRDVPVRAHIETISGFSGHADYLEIMAWLAGFTRPPERTFIVHGEADAADALAARIRSHFKWDVTVPKEGDSFLLDF